MKIKIDTDLLTSTIKSIQKLARAPLLIGEVRGKFLRLTVTGGGNSCSMTVPCTVIDKGGEREFAVDGSNFASAVNKRKDLELEIEASVLKMRAKGGYVAELMVQPTEEVVVVPEQVKEGKATMLGDAFLNRLRTYLAKIELRPLLSIYSHVPLAVRATPKGTFVACFDHYQAAFTFDRKLKSKDGEAIDFVIPSSLFSMIAGEIKGQDYKLAITDTAVYAYNDAFELAIATSQPDGESITLDNVIELYDGLAQRKLDKVVLKTDSLTKFFDNAKAVYDKESVFELVAKGGKGNIKLTSAFGSVKSALKLGQGSSDISLKCDFSFFRAMMAKAPDTLELEVVPEFIVFRNDPVTYLMSLV
jgi:hypothetical protein